MTDTSTTLQLKGQTVKINGLEMYYEEAGEGAPLLILHGGTGTGRDWQPYLPALTKYFRVIMPDSRGHGRTNNPPGKLSYRVMADDFAAFVQVLGLTKPYIFGYSDGGQILLEFGMHHPDVASALVIGGATYAFSPSYYNTVNSFGFISNGLVDLEGLERDEPEWAASLKGDHVDANDPDKWKKLLTQITPLWLTPLDYALIDLAKITTPTLILVGDRDKGVLVEQTVAMYRTIPKAELVVLPNADHGSAGWLDDGPNPLFTEAIAGFLLRHPVMPANPD